MKFKINAPASRRIMGRTSSNVLSKPQFFNKKFLCIYSSLFHFLIQREFQEADEDEDEEIVLEDLSSILDEGPEADYNFFLPPHFRCASHTLNRIAVQDCIEAMKNTDYANI